VTSNRLALATIKNTLGQRRQQQGALDASAEPRAFAAVATVLREGPGSAEALFIRRAERDGDPWSGDIAFPGGRHDDKDASLLATALRETEEEVGLRLAPESLLVRLEDVVGRTSATRVAHFVFALDDGGARLTPNGEVAALLWVPLAVLVAPERAGRKTWERGGYSVELPCIHLDGYVLWGMTHRMTETLLAAVAG
jgi:8-oxo-dGTP pyrophosphatase MutT (NUDIX family)